MKSLTSVLGWLLLLAVLAVPSFLFYNWWSKSKQQASSELAQDPVQTNIFPASDKPRAALPPARSTAPAAAQAAAPQPAQQVPAAAQPAAAAQQAPAPGAVRAAQPAQPQAQAVQPPPAQPAQPAQVQASSAPARQVAVSTAPKPVSYFEPRTDRDPTLSPADYSRIKKAELDRIEAARRERMATIRRNVEPSIESRLQLQGIVGNAAIINGDMYSAGQTVRGAKILKVGPNYIIGEYKGKKFRKVLR